VSKVNMEGESYGEEGGYQPQESDETFERKG